MHLAQDDLENNGLSKIESNLRARVSEDISRDQRHAYWIACLKGIAMMKKSAFAYMVTIGLLLSSNLFGAEERPRVVVIPLIEERTGNALEEEVLSSMTFSNADNAGLTGTMPDNGAVNFTPGTSAKTISEGYHNGSGTVAGDADLVPGNISSGVAIFGVTGTVIEAVGDAAVGSVLSGATFSNEAASGLTGTMPDNGAVNLTPGTSSQSIAEGYHDGSGTVAGDAELTSGNIKNGVAIFGLTGTVIEAIGDASTSEVLVGNTFSKAGVSGLSGTMPDNGAVYLTPGTAAQAIAEGYHNGFGSVGGDADLAAGNIKSGVEIFGTTGDSNVVNTSSGDAIAEDILGGRKAWVDGTEITGTATVCAIYPPANVPKSGQGVSYYDGDDGDWQRGAEVKPKSLRFTDNGDGTVTDNLTGLIWLKNANCANATRGWITVFSDVVQLNTGGTMNGNDCGDTSNFGSHQTDWRVPHWEELRSLVDYSQDGPSLPAGHPFYSVQPFGLYWSSTTEAGDTSHAWSLDLRYGNLTAIGKSLGRWGPWPVRGG